MPQNSTVPVIDIFAGPGGLGEGFSSFQAQRGHRPFRVRLSVEKDGFAHQTLRLRSFFRQFSPAAVPEIYYKVLRQELPLCELREKVKSGKRPLDPQWLAAEQESLHAELGGRQTDAALVHRRIRDAIGDHKKPWVLIGGPPCQAYSIVGRVRNRGNSEYRIENDHRSQLYREYLRIIAEHWPAVFIMENVKGLLSATIRNQKIFERILCDLQSPLSAFRRGVRIKTAERYRVVPLVQRQTLGLSGIHHPNDFVIACESYGIPQIRHRVILVGIREDLGEVDLPSLIPAETPSVGDVIGDLPKLRSGLSRKKVRAGYVTLDDSPENWLRTIVNYTFREVPKGERRWLKTIRNDNDAVLCNEIVKTVRSLKAPFYDRGSEFVPCTLAPVIPNRLRSWFLDERLTGVCNHVSRIHMDSDLVRYLFAACYGKVHGLSPKLDQFPTDLQPDHENAATGDFDDRFRVQVAGGPSTTITSHLSKDGHYFIHPDPSQCRSLTVREAARIQTFPDNYYFCGPRTAQYVQVGNAVPPLLACQIARCVWELLVKAGKAD
jgi:DNA (cytosine-5)-methyltransferase 1